MSFDYLHLYRPNEHNEKFLFKIENEKYIHVGENLFSFETNGEILEYSSERGNNDIKFPYGYSKENIYFMLHQKYIPIKEYKNSTVKHEYQYLYKMNEEFTNDIEGSNIVYGNDFINCKIIHSKH